MAAKLQDVIMLLGDSLTELGFSPGGFGARLAEVYNRKLDVVNRGYAGYNTDWMLPVFEQAFAPRAQHAHLPAVRLLVIWLGANDASLPGARTGQHVPLARFRANLAGLVRAVRDPASARYSPETRVLLVTPTPVNGRMWGEALARFEPPFALDRRLEDTRVYAEAVREVGREEGVPVVDMWGRIWEAAGGSEEGLGEVLLDGLHFNARGYEIVYEEIMKKIEEAYPELRYDRLQTTFVDWTVIKDDVAQYQRLVKARDVFGTVKN